MKVKDLIKKLSAVDDLELEILCYSENSESDSNCIFEIENISINEAEKSRNNGTPQLKFEKSECSKKLALIMITSDF